MDFAKIKEDSLILSCPLEGLRINSRTGIIMNVRIGAGSPALQRIEILCFGRAAEGGIEPYGPMAGEYSGCCRVSLRISIAEMILCKATEHDKNRAVWP